MFQNFKLRIVLNFINSKRFEFLRLQNYHKSRQIQNYPNLTTIDNLLNLLLQRNLKTLLLEADSFFSSQSSIIHFISSYRTLCTYKFEVIQIVSNPIAADDGNPKERGGEKDQDDSENRPRTTSKIEIQRFVTVTEYHLLKRWLSLRYRLTWSVRWMGSVVDVKNWPPNWNGGKLKRVLLERSRD